jgi:tetratricopeptide (TPR) repeat protein
MSYDMQPLRARGQAVARPFVWLWQHRPRAFRSFAELRRLSVDLSVLVVVAALVWITAAATFDGNSVIEPISVPKAMEEEGFTGVAVAHALADGIYRIRHGSKNTDRPNELNGSNGLGAGFQLASDSRFADAVSISIPSSGLSIHSIVSLLRPTLGISTPRASGEIVKSANTNGSGVRYSLRLHLTDDTWSNSVVLDGADLEDVIELGAQAISERFYLSNLAFYLDGLPTTSGAEKTPSRLDELLARIVSSGDSKDVAWALTLQGLQLEKKKQPVNEAINKYQAAIEYNSSYAGAHLSWGNALEGLGRYQQAIDQYRAAIKANPNYVEAYNNLGVALTDSGKPEEAIDNLRKAVGLNPRHADAYANWGYALYEKDKKGDDKQAIEQAIERTRRAIDFDPKHSRAYSNWCFLLHVQGNYDDAIAKCSKAVELKADNALAYFNWGDSLRDKATKEADKNKAKALKDEAVEKYHRATEMAPKLNAAYKNEADLLRALGKEAEAVAVMEAAKKAGAT